MLSRVFFGPTRSMLTPQSRRCFQKRYRQVQSPLLPWLIESPTIMMAMSPSGAFMGCSLRLSFMGEDDELVGVLRVEGQGLVGVEGDRAVRGRAVAEGGLA